LFFDEQAERIRMLIRKTWINFMYFIIFDFIISDLITCY
jgi:hypothetical protein